ncbi:MAG TPA: hypothetical protein PKK31_02190 [Elusimicrobiales bacterium]|nr:hypothetical protein [Elusimicrobiales bacterium]
MKKSNILIAMITVLTAASTLKAEEIKVDFDGGRGGLSDSAALADVMKELSATELPEDVKKPEELEVLPSAGDGKVEIKIAMKIGDREKKEIVTCNAELGLPLLGTCKKESDLKPLFPGDISAMSLRGYFPEIAPATAADFPFMQNKHSYTNQNGPQVFQCDDYCENYELESVSAGTGGVNGTWVCKSWTHRCVCIKNCY